MYTQTTITGKPKVSLAEQQVRARAKATAERSDYSFKLGNITIREKGSAQAKRIGTVEVRNLKSGACYTVAFLPKSKPLCNCPAALKMAGTSYSCKHTLLAREFVGMVSHFEEEEPAGEEPKPAVGGCAKKSEYGERKTVLRDGVFQIDRLTVGFAYPKNGNVHNSTPRFLWVVLKNNCPMGQYDSLKAAKVLLEDCKQEKEEEPQPASPEVRARIGNPLLDTTIVQEQDGRFYVHRIYGDGRYGFERQLSALNPGRETQAEAEADLAALRSLRAIAAKKPLCDF